MLLLCYLVLKKELLNHQNQVIPVYVSFFVIISGDDDSQNSEFHIIL